MGLAKRLKKAVIKAKMENLPFTATYQELKCSKEKFRQLMIYKAGIYNGRMIKDRDSNSQVHSEIPFIADRTIQFMMNTRSKQIKRKLTSPIAKFFENKDGWEEKNEHWSSFESMYLCPAGTETCFTDPEKNKIDSFLRAIYPEVLELVKKQGVLISNEFVRIYGANKKPRFAFINNVCEGNEKETIWHVDTVTFCSVVINLSDSCPAVLEFRRNRILKTVALNNMGDYVIFNLTRHRVVSNGNDLNLSRKTVVFHY
jgi:hypothetical protein